MAIDLEPGPIARLNETALRPFPGGVSFEGIVAAGLEGAAGVDAGLARTKLESAGDGVPDLDGAFTSTVGVALDVLSGTTGAEDDGTAGTLADRTAGVEAYRQEVLPHVPQPDVKIEGGFVDPPAPPKTDAGREPPPDGRGV
jgi:hypothetical protein